MIPSYENFKDFKDAGEKILEYLHNHLGCKRPLNPMSIF